MIDKNSPENAQSEYLNQHAASLYDEAKYIFELCVDYMKGGKLTGQRKPCDNFLASETLAKLWKLSAIHLGISPRKRVRVPQRLITRFN